MNGSQEVKNPAIKGWIYIFIGMGWIGLSFILADYLRYAYIAVGGMNILIGFYYHPKIKQKLKRKRSNQS